LYFKATAGHVLAEVKSCYDSNLHAQFRRGIAQLVEYEFIYRKLLGEDIGKLLVLEMRPPSRLEWLIGLATHLEITIAWLSEDGTGLESSMDLSDSLAKIVKLC
jgi:hypothetical protein